jgi:cysteine-rich repeat protein
MWMGQLDCDDGDGINTNGCSNAGTINSGYYCKKGTVGAMDVCPEVCGDNFNYSVSGGATCDDANNLPYDGCSPICQVETGYTCTHTGTNQDTCTEICGDYYDFHAYQCNDGNALRYDGCDDKCRIENGFICFGGTEDRPDVCEELCEDYSDWHHYECELGPGVIGDGCNRYCEIEIGWFCNTGMPGSEDFCWPPCGDGRVVGPEQCDDGPWINNSNTYPAATDGCYNCIIGIGWTCWNSSPYTPSHCEEICGDGYDFLNYPCDDGNLVNGDGCDSYCRIEIGFTCGGGNYNPNPDTCIEICGDGKDFHWYACDDGNLVNGDGCDSNCNI